MSTTLPDGAWNRRGDRSGFQIDQHSGDFAAANDLCLLCLRQRESLDQPLPYFSGLAQTGSRFTIFRFLVIINK
jgi:hypothetical protein